MEEAFSLSRIYIHDVLENKPEMTSTAQ